MQREARGWAGDGGRGSAARGRCLAPSRRPDTSAAPGVAAHWLIPQEAPQRRLRGECARHLLVLGDKTNEIFRTEPSSLGPRPKALNYIKLYNHSVGKRSYTPRRDRKPPRQPIKTHNTYTHGA